MATQIFNGGVRGAILRLAKDKGAKLTDEQEKQLEVLESLPKNQWIDLDDNGNPITKEEAQKNWEEHLSQFKPIK